MKVLYLFDSDFPWDIRVEKSCDTLVDNGWDVHLVCRNKACLPISEKKGKLTIHRLPYLTETPGKLNNIINFPLFFNPVWLNKLLQVANNYTFNVIIVRDLPMALAAILIGKLKQIPVILDMAECYPELIRLIWKYEPFKIQNLIIRNPYFVDLVEKIVLSKISHTLVMVEESKNRLLSKGIPESKVTIVSNTPVKQKFIDAKVSFPGTLKDNKDKLILLYVGFLNYSRGIDTVLESLKNYVDHNKNVYLCLVGTGTAEVSMKRMIKHYDLNEYVGFEGWVDNKLVPEYIASSDICLVPHHKCTHWDNTIPNKLFDYMAAGKPVLVSNVDPMKRIVNETNCGLVYKDNDINDFVTKLMSLDDKQIRHKYGINGVNAVIDIYNWDNDSERMLTCMNKYK